MKKKARWLAAGAAVAVLVVAAALLLPREANAPPEDLPQQLQRIVTQAVERDRSVRNCVLAVVSGDGSFAWAGAASLAADGRPMTADTPIYVASVTKLYTAAAVLLLAERGRLSLDEPMAKYLPAPLVRGLNRYGGVDRSDRITIRQLLSHRSGIADYYDEKGADGKTFLELLEEQPGRAWTVDETIERARTLPAHAAPGELTFYADTNFQLLGKIVEAVTGRPLGAVFDEFFFAPLHLTHTHLGPRPGVRPAAVFDGAREITAVRANAAYWADGGIVSTAREMALFLKALHEGRVLRPESLRSMHEWQRWRFPLQYGLGTMRFALPWPLDALGGLGPLWGHSGSTGSFAYRSDTLDLYLAGTLDQTAATAEEAFLLMRQALRAVAASRRRAG